MKFEAERGGRGFSERGKNKGKGHMAERIILAQGPSSMCLWPECAGGWVEWSVLGSKGYPETRQGGPL